MKRSSFKYIFYFNVLLLCIMCAMFFVFKSENQKSAEPVPLCMAANLVSNQSETVVPKPSANACVVIDAKSGAVLYEENSDKELPMASTTKIMTAIAVMENSSVDDIITVTNDSVGIEGTSIYLKQGERLTVKDLLYGLLLESGNDAASALAIGVFGTEQKCTEKMNGIAKEMGLVHTHFENVHGLSSENHYTSAYELALIMRRAMQNKDLSMIMSTKNYTSRGENPRYFSNHNRLLKSCSFITGGKTGYTKKSGRCLVTSSRFSDKEYIAVTLGASNDWQDHKNMHLFASENYFSVEIADKDNFYVLDGTLKYIPAESVYLTLDRDTNFALTYKFTFCNNICKAEYFDGQIPLGKFYLTPE